MLLQNFIQYLSRVEVLLFFLFSTQESRIVPSSADDSQSQSDSGGHQSDLNKGNSITRKGHIRLSKRIRFNHFWSKAFALHHNAVMWLWNRVLIPKLPSRNWRGFVTTGLLQHVCGQGFCRQLAIFTLRKGLIKFTENVH